MDIFSQCEIFNLTFRKWSDLRKIKQKPTLNDLKPTPVQIRVNHSFLPPEDGEREGKSRHPLKGQGKKHKTENLTTSTSKKKDDETEDNGKYNAQVHHMHYKEISK